MREPVSTPCERLAAMLRPGGEVARLLDGFELRPGQLEMLAAVYRALEQDHLLAVEAGTGVGKSLAYGLPAADFSRRREEKVVISSATINLQEQLVGKDLPLVSRALGREIKVALLKGRSNYLCRRRLAELRSQRMLFEEDISAEQLQALETWAETSTDGSLSETGFALGQAVREAVASDADACLGKRCPHRRECFFLAARRRAAGADVLVVNHHLLCAHLAVCVKSQGRGRGVLPRFSRLVIDEAHELEDAASSFFGVTLTALGTQRIFGRLVGQRGRGLLGALVEETGRPAFAAAEAETWRGSLHRIRTGVQEARAAYAGAFERLQALVRRAGQEGRLRLDERLRRDEGWLSLEEAFCRAATLTSSLAEETERLCQGISLSREEDSLVMETLAWCARAKQLAAETELAVAINEEEFVRWAESFPPRHRVGLQAAPIDIAPFMQQALFENLRTVVFTSATLAIGGSFDFFSRRLGLDRQPRERLHELVVPSPFDFAAQARLLVPLDLPLPDRPGYRQALEPALLRAAAASSGRALILFTSRSLMQEVCQNLRPRLEKLGLEVFCQGDRSRDELLRRFRECRRGVLFGVESFWQGVDVVGEALRQVIICRLPFDVPSEPLAQARGERIERNGGSAFRDYFLPRAVLKLKQGFGRLVRSRSDWGVVCVLDSRLLGRSYGERFLESLPPAGRIVGTLDEIVDALWHFFEQHGEPGIAVVEEEFSSAPDGGSVF